MRIGIVGAGSIGCRHARNCLTLGHEIRLHDPHPQGPSSSLEELGQYNFPDPDGFWGEEYDVVLVASPTSKHLEHALMALEHGSDLFVEKPLSYNDEGIGALEELALHKARVTMVACNMRFHPGPRALKKLLEDGSLGIPHAVKFHCGSFLADWRPWQNYRSSYSADPLAGGVIFDVIHEIDLALWLAGPADVLASFGSRATQLGLETEGLCEIILRHGTGCLSNLHLNYVQRDYHRTCQIIGSEGTAYWDFNDSALKIRRKDSVRIMNLYEQYDPNEMYLRELAHLFECVETRSPSVNPLRGGRDALHIASVARGWPGFFAGG